MSKPEIDAKEDQLLVVIANSAALIDVGLDMKMIDAVPFSPSKVGAATDTGAASRFRIMVGRIKTRKAESADEVRPQLLYLSEALNTLRQMSQQQMSELVEKLQPAAEERDRDRFKPEYGVLNVEEMADRLNCSPEMVRAREVAGDIFAACAPGRDGGPLYPRFQLNDRLDKSLLKKVILEYREANVSTTMLWTFLRSGQKIFSGWTPMEMMLGAMPPAFAQLTPEEWDDAFLDVVAEELSRVR